jgi:predicted glutamine amidotransferase
MCGICGVYALSCGTPEQKVFKSLLLLNVWRGEHSTGVVHIESKGGAYRYRSQRTTAPSPSYIYSKLGQDFLDHNTKGSRTIGYIGHTRSATKGSITVKNAHPFSFPNVVGVHNGTITKAFKGSKDFETDSEALYALINELGLEGALNEVAGYDTTYALCFVDKAENTLNFIRNSKRPLHFTYAYNQTTLIWSSTKEMLEMAVDRSMNVQNKGWKGDDKDRVFTLEENTLLSFKIGASPETAELTKIPVKTVVSTVSRPLVVSAGYGGTGYGRMDYSGMGDIYGDDDALPDSYDHYVAGTVICPDGRFRTSYEKRKWEKEEAAKSDALKRAEAAFKPKAAQPGEYAGHRQHHSTDGLRALAWLKDDVDSSPPVNTEAANDAPESIPTKHQLIPLYGTEPVTAAELAFKLSTGCMCCGTIVDPSDVKEVERTKWWNRDYYACGDCYDNSDGDWVRCTMDDESWGDVSKVVQGGKVVTIN